MVSARAAKLCAWVVTRYAWPMAKPKLTYFDAPTSRGEECRLALHLAGLDFDDERIPFSAWAARKPATPFGSVPVLELPGRPPLAQSNAILVFIGRGHGLHPKDDFEAARHEAMMAHVEDLRSRIGFTLDMVADEKKAARELLARQYVPAWAANAERQIAEGPFFAGPNIHVVDLKLYMVLSWLTSGKLDHVPTDLVAPHAKLVRLHQAVGDDARVRAWSERKP